MIFLDRITEILCLDEVFIHCVEDDCDEMGDVKNDESEHYYSVEYSQYFFSVYFGVDYTEEVVNLNYFECVEHVHPSGCLIGYYKADGKYDKKYYIEKIEIVSAEVFDV